MKMKKWFYEKMMSEVIKYGDMWEYIETVRNQKENNIVAVDENGFMQFICKCEILKETEKAKGLKEITIAIDGIAVVVNKANPLVNAKIEIVRDIYMGKIQKWSEIK